MNVNNFRKIIRNFITVRVNHLVSEITPRFLNTKKWEIADYIQSHYLSLCLRESSQKSYVGEEKAVYQPKKTFFTCCVIIVYPRQTFSISSSFDLFDFARLRLLRRFFFGNRLFLASGWYFFERSNNIVNVFMHERLSFYTLVKLPDFQDIFIFWIFGQFF